MTHYTSARNSERLTDSLKRRFGLTMYCFASEDPLVIWRIESSFNFKEVLPRPDRFIRFELVHEGAYLPVYETYSSMAGRNFLIFNGHQVDRYGMSE